MDSYKYKALPITPAIIEYLIIELLNGQTSKRDDIVKLIIDTHISSGGLPSEASDFSRSVKKALSQLKEKGHALNKSYGYWQILKNDSPIQIIDKNISEFEISEIPTHTTYGKGNYSVYLYYFPTYRAHAETKGGNTWPCKIGRTDRDPLLRIISQISTALPEMPTVEFIIKTDNSSLLEAMLHSILTIRGKHIKGSPGTEWFDTSPDEVLEILRYVKSDLM